MDALTELRTRFASIERGVETNREKIKTKRQEIEKIEKEIMALEDDIISKNQSMHDIEIEIERTVEEPHVTDHALVRYLERKYEVDIEGIRQEILSERMIAAINFGARGVKTEEGYFAIRGPRVVTFML